MSTLSAAQAAVVGAPPDLPEGVDWPRIAYDIDDLGDVPDYSFSKHPRQPATPEGEAPSLAGYNAVVQRDGKWFAHREYDGGASGSIGYDTRDEAVAEIQSEVARTAAFWMEKVGWKIAGDQCDGRDWRGRHKQQVIRCGGVHYVIGREPSDAEFAADNRYGCFGFGGRQMAWRLLATGQQVQGRNCWYQGRVPAEFRDLLPDNAERVVSPQEREAEARQAEWLAQHRARMAAREELRASLAPFSATGRRHPLPEQGLMHVESIDEDYDDTVGDVRTPTRDLDAATVMTSEFHGFAGDGRGDDWHRPVLDLDIDAKLLPSSTPGHFHLFIDKPMRWDAYAKLLEALAEAGVIEQGYVDASLARKHTAVRLPWVRKGAYRRVETSGDVPVEIPPQAGDAS